MASAEGVKSKIQGLITSANATTGAGDTTLTGAVNSLIRQLDKEPVNGVIKQFKVRAGYTIAPGDFVALEREWGNARSGEESISGDAIHAVCTGVLLSDSKRLYVTKNAGLNYAYATVVSIDGATASSGTSVKISDNIKDESGLQVVALSASKVLVFYTDASTNYGMVVVLHISGNIITATAPVAYYQGLVRYQSIVALSESLLFVAHCNTSGSTGQGRLLNVSGDTISTVQSTYFDSNVEVPRVVKLTSSKVLVTYRIYDTQLVKARVVTTDGTNLALGTITNVTTAGIYGGPISAAALSDCRVIVTFVPSDNYGPLYAVALTIAGSEIIKGGIVTVHANTDGVHDIAPLNANKAMIMYDYASGGSGYTEAVVLNVPDATQLTVSSPTVVNNIALGQAATRAIRLIPISESAVMAFLITNKSTDASSAYYAKWIRALTINGNMISASFDAMGTYVRRATSSLSKDVGVAKTAGSGGETISVYCVE